MDVLCQLMCLKSIILCRLLCSVFAEFPLAICSGFRSSVDFGFLCVPDLFLILLFHLIFMISFGNLFSVIGGTVWVAVFSVFLALSEIFFIIAEFKI